MYALGRCSPRPLLIVAKRVVANQSSLLHLHTQRAGLHSSPAAASAAANMERVTFGSGHIAYEIGDKAKPAVIVLQEWWGVNDIIKELAMKISHETGYRCLIPDLYKGKIGVDAEEASHLMNSLDFKAAVSELQQAVTYLKESGAKKVGCAGFCMGGALTFAAAQHAGVECAAPFYGTPDPAICDPAAIKIPVQVHSGQLDTLNGFSDPQAIKAVVDKIKAAGGAVELFMYDGCGHAFMNALTPGGQAKIKEIGQAQPPEQEPKQAFDRMSAFFQKHLG